MGKYRLCGQITVLASLILGVTAVLAVVCVRSVVFNMSLLRVNESVNLGVESVFSEYLRPLFERYQIFGFQCDGENDFTSKLSEYMSYNLDCEKGLPLWKTTFFKLKEKEIQIDELKKLTDEEGKIFANQVTDYMRYAAPVEVIEKWTKVLENVGDTKAAEEAFEEYMEVVEYAAQIDEQVMEIVQKIDRVRENRILENMKRLDTELVLINMAYYSPQSMGVIKSDGYYRILDEILRENKNLQQILNSFPGDFQKIEELCEKLKEKSGQALKSLQQRKKRLAKELYEAYEESYAEFENYQNRILAVDKEGILAAAQGNLPVLAEAYGIESLLKIPPDIGNLQAISNEIHIWEKVIEEFDYGGFVHQYEGQVYEKGNAMGTVSRIKQLLTDGVLSFVLPRGSVISGKRISYTNLASKTEGIKMGSDYMGAVSDIHILEDILFNEYVMGHFDSYTDTVTQPTASVQYEVEYVICGKTKDRENLEDVINHLVLVRSGFNLAHILADVEKKAETKAYGVMLLGFTGSPAIIRLGQCLLMSAWAYGEAINDVGILMKGGKISLTKTNANWNTTFNEVITLNFKMEPKQQGELSYEDYLRILLFLSNRKKKYYRTMDMVEVGMEDAGYKNVRLSEMYCVCKGSVLFRINEMNYEQKFEYGY